MRRERELSDETWSLIEPLLPPLKRHARFARDGVWDRVLTVLLSQADAAGVLDWQPSVDSTITRAHQHATNTTREVVSMTERCAGGSSELHVSARRAG